MSACQGFLGENYYNKRGMKSFFFKNEVNIRDEKTNFKQEL